MDSGSYYLTLIRCKSHACQCDSLQKPDKERLMRRHTTGDNCYAYACARRIYLYVLFLLCVSIHDDGDSAGGSTAGPFLHQQCAALSRRQFAAPVVIEYSKGCLVTALDTVVKWQPRRNPSKRSRHQSLRRNLLWRPIYR